MASEAFIPRSGANGAIEVLNGTKNGAFSCETKPKPVRDIGFPKLSVALA
jgi:hypothetical protein